MTKANKSSPKKSYSSAVKGITENNDLFHEDSGEWQTVGKNNKIKKEKIQ